MNCQYCNRELSNAGSLSLHEKHCKDNPNRVQRNRSPNAGPKKGSTPWNKGREIGRYKKWDEKFSLENVLTENSTYARHHVKRRILEKSLVEYKCQCCGIGPEWQGKPMPLILDHINGINNDNRVENLRFVCSNCDSQLDTYKSRNRKKKGVVAESGLLQLT
jgi:Zn finger protein HypA/HybF involved in hydrogenase expression